MSQSFESQSFDAYDKSYGAVVQSSIDFTGLSHDFAMVAKADVLRETIAARLGRDARPEALDIGCGIGTFHPYARALFGRLSGADVSSACIAQARAANPGVGYMDYAGGVLPYEDASFDLSLTICVMHHVPPAQWPRFVREMRRVTRPGGLVCVIEHNPLNPVTRLAVNRCEFDRDAVLLRAGRTERLLAEAGLREVASRFFLFLPWASVTARRIERKLGNVPFGAQYLASALV